ncbi:hypothetical protein PS2_008906 [Malus domestica]
MKTEQEKLEKLARKGPTPEEKPAASSGVSVSDAKPSTFSSGASTAKRNNPNCDLSLWSPAQGQGNNPESRIPTTWKPITSVCTPSSMEMAVGHQTIIDQGKV